ncbi:hypothetical protein ABZ851_33220 [Streptomyces sp. NPDC047049]|uniref:WD40 repeat domain-containing protein n=1 Tax=Streptomyces sp. NPDC047049 TaxID=3156688 RepID=UPI0033F6556D
MNLTGSPPRSAGSLRRKSGVLHSCFSLASRGEPEERPGTPRNERREHQSSRSPPRDVAARRDRRWPEHRCVAACAAAGGAAERGAARAFSPDGSVLAAAGGGKVHLWEPATGRQVGEPLEHDDSISSFAFSSDGSLLAAGGVEGEVQLYARRPHGRSPGTERSAAEAAADRRGLGSRQAHRLSTFAGGWHRGGSFGRRASAFFGRVARISRSRLRR